MSHARATGRKQPVTVRMSETDVDKVKRLAERLGVHDSDVIRFAIKLMLAEFTPLHDPEIRGRKLLPVFVESGSRLFRHFELDATRLDSIINEGAPPESRIAREDLEMLSMAGLRMAYALPELPSEQQPRGNDEEGSERDQGNGGTEGRGHSLRNYLYGKYMRRST